MPLGRAATSVHYYEHDRDVEPSGTVGGIATAEIQHETSG